MPASWVARKKTKTMDSFELHIGMNHFEPLLMKPMIMDERPIVFLSSIGHDSIPGIYTVKLEWGNINYGKPGSLLRIVRGIPEVETGQSL